MKNLQFTNVHEAAIGIQRACDLTSMPDLYLMPYSRYSASDSTLWWLCTKKAQTAYDQGKFVIGKPSRFGMESGVVCGLHVERGVKQSIDKASEKLGPSWKWNDFVDAMSATALSDAVEKASLSLTAPLEAHVCCSSSDPSKVDRIRFSTSGKLLSLTGMDLGLGILKRNVIVQRLARVVTTFGAIAIECGLVLDRRLFVRAVHT